MSGKTAGQFAYEAFVAWREERDPMMVVADWTHPMVEAARGGWEAAAAAVETEQLRRARADRDQLRKAALDLAAQLETAAAHTLSREAAEAKREAAQRLRKIAEPPS